LDGENSDRLCRHLTTPPTRRGALMGLVGGTLSLLGLADATAKKKKKKKKKGGGDGGTNGGASCTPNCAGRDCGDPDGCGGRCQGPCFACEVCVNGACQPGCADGLCLANNTCADECAGGDLCPEACTCLPHILVGNPAGDICIQASNRCDTPACASDATCPPGEACMRTFCGMSSANRCFPVCAS
jgi:hypothetical protein